MQFDLYFRVIKKTMFKNIELIQKLTDIVKCVVNLRNHKGVIRIFNSVVFNRLLTVIINNG